MSVSFGFPFFSTVDECGDEKRGTVQLYMKPMTKVTWEHSDYTLLSLMAEIGGYYGLLIGLSLVDAAGLLTWICTSLRTLH